MLKVKLDNAGWDNLCFTYYVSWKMSAKKSWVLANFDQKIALKNRVATLPGKPGEPGKVREFENWPEKSENLKIDQKIREKPGNFIFPFE